MTEAANGVERAQLVDEQWKTPHAEGHGRHELVDGEAHDPKGREEAREGGAEVGEVRRPPQDDGEAQHDDGEGREAKPVDQPPEAERHDRRVHLGLAAGGEGQEAGEGQGIGKPDGRSRRECCGQAGTLAPWCPS